MSPEILAPAVLVLFAIAVVVHTQWLAPRRARRKVAATLGEQGWKAVAPEAEPGWQEVMTLAIEQRLGAFQVREYDETIGPARFHTTRTERRSGRSLDVYRETGATRPLYAAVGIREERTVYRSFASRRQYGGAERGVWVGETRPIPVDKPEMVFSGTAEIVGSFGRGMARKRGLDPETIPALASPPEGGVARAVREILLADERAGSLMARVLLGPRAWVLVVPLARAERRLGAVLDLAREISAEIDRHIGWARS